MKKALALFATILLFSFSTFAQNSASADVNVTATVAKGLTISPTNENLDFGLVVLDPSNPPAPVIDPGNGAQFLVNGEPGRNVTISYTDISLAGPSGSTAIPFTSNLEQTGTSSTYTGASSVVSGSTAGLDGTNGNLYLWLGGNLTVAANQMSGNYSGTFTISVAY